MPEIPDTAENLQACLCPGCPSKPDDGEGGLYCGRGLSAVRTQTTGCRCTDCAVYQRHDLREGYFCAVEPALWSRVRDHARTQDELRGAGGQADDRGGRDAETRISSSD